MAVIYKTSWVSWFLAKCFLNVQFVSIVNIINKRKIVKEFLQNNSDPKVIAKHVDDSLKSNSKVNYKNILDPFTQTNVYKKTANHIIKLKF